MNEIRIKYLNQFWCKKKKKEQGEFPEFLQGVDQCLQILSKQLTDISRIRGQEPHSLAVEPVRPH